MCALHKPYYLSYPFFLSSSLTCEEGWLEVSHGGWEASMGPPPHRRVPAGDDRWHRSQHAHHRITEPEGQGGSSHTNTQTHTHPGFLFTGKGNPTGIMADGLLVFSLHEALVVLLRLSFSVGHIKEMLFASIPGGHSAPAQVLTLTS